MLKNNDIEKEIISFFRRIKVQYKVTFLNTFLWGIIAHGMTLFNKYSLHDDNSCLFSVGMTYSSGRWMLGLLGACVTKFFGGWHYSLPLINGLVSILFVSITACILVNLFEIWHNGYCIALGGVMITTPVITGLFGFMFTAPYYMFALLLGMVGAFLICKYHRWYTFLGGIFLICCSVGIYQAYIPVVISTFLLYIIKNVVCGRDVCKWSDFFKNCLYYAAACVGSILLYLLLNKYILYLNGTTLTNYQGIDKMAKEPIIIYFSRAINSYGKILIRSHIYPGRMWHLYLFLLLLVVMLTIWLIFRILRQSIQKAIQTVVLMIFMPLAVNFIYVMCEPDSVHLLMSYGQIMLFVYCIWLLEQMALSITKIKNIFYLVGTSIMLLFSVMYCRFDNICYLKAEFVQEEMISYYTTLITKIKSTEHYSDKLPVVFVNAGNIEDMSLAYINAFEDIDIAPYVGIKLGLNDYAWLEFMKIWCGYSPAIMDAKLFDDLPEVQAMPSYPDDGSIQIINNTVVVKLGDKNE